MLIGRRGLIDRAAGVQIVDWRDAPVSQVYYRYDEGDDYDEEVAGGTLRGIVEARRNVTIAGGKLRRIGCPQGTFVGSGEGEWFELYGDEVALLAGGQGTAARPPRPGPPQQRGKRRMEPARSSHEANKALPEIAALIDRAQFDLITEPGTGLVVIQGGAGSGKTTVALHRIAYLVFNDPRNFKPSRCLFVVPSEALARYVAGVLPALGVQGVPVTTFRSWARNLRKRLVPSAPDKYAEDTPVSVARFKKHPALLALAEAAVERGAGGGAARSSSSGSARRRARRGCSRHGTRTPASRRWCARARRGDRSSAARPATWICRRRRCTPPSRRCARSSRASATCGASCSSCTPIAGGSRRCAARACSSRRARASSRSWCAGARCSSKRRSRPSSTASTRSACGPSTACRSTTARMRAARARASTRRTTRLLLRLYQLVHGELTRVDGESLVYDHIALDEAQDLSASEVKVLYYATNERRSVTIAGDVAQRVIFDNAFRGWEALLGDVGVPAVKVRPLRLAYRSTAPVMRFARRVLGPLAATEATDVEARPGAEVTLHPFDGMGEAVAFVADALRSLVGREPAASVALLTRHAGQADAWWGALARAEVPQLRRVRRQDFAFAPGVDVTDVGQVKGLEFDYVILLDVNASSYPGHRRGAPPFAHRRDARDPSAVVGVDGADVARSSRMR